MQFLDLVAHSPFDFKILKTGPLSGFDLAPGRNVEQGFVIRCV